MRIVSGKFRGRKLAKSDHLKSLRPTTDRNRESLFNILFSSGFKFENAQILDLCCGSGAVAFEALSRGAESATLIDLDRKHLEITKKNSEILGVENQIEIICADAKKLPENKKFFDLIFIDPPYSQDYLPIIESLLQKNWIEKNSLIVVEFRSEKIESHSRCETLQIIDSRSYGETSFLFLKLK